MEYSYPHSLDYPQYQWQHEPHYMFQQPAYTYQEPLSKARPQKSPSQPRQVQISHPYARLFAKKDEVKRRKIWNHVLEKSIFNPFELRVQFLYFQLVILKSYHRSTLGAPTRRTIYIASLEAHVDQLHSQLLE